MLLQKQREFNLTKMENEKRIVELENEKLQQDIENKNNELAAATMGMIKKNEFLTQIKNEINAIESSKSASEIVKIIDNNINKNADWEMFQEIFNNTDKDFLKKIKSLHNNLTPNDLKLCAY